MVRNTSTIPRWLEVPFAMGVLFLLSPVLLVLSILIYLTSGSPVIFKQSRLGLNNSLFIIRKFRTMTTASGPSGEPLDDCVRITKIGLFLRSWSLDELPTFWNVLVGDMTLVGPRPLLPSYALLYTPSQARRALVKPGITGWAQVCGRNGLTWEEKFDKDIWYVENRSSALDARILLRTCIVVLKREGVSAPGEVTMGKFNGSEPAREKK
jgi:lipopolysaccharide/colanic/teichoic acid biosynthesis glycosyltransferase